MAHEIELVSDGEGVALFGDAGAIERFLDTNGLPARPIVLPKAASTLDAAAGATQAASEVMANSGRWVKLTEKSAAAMKKADLMKGSEPGVSRAVVTEKGKIKGLLEITTPGRIAANPAMLAGAAGMMAQMAMKQTMDEITDYLAAIDEKVEDVLRAQKDAALSMMIGADFVVAEAMTIRDEVGRVSQVTWSKVKETTMPIAQTQAYALRQLSAIAEKLEGESKVSEIAKKAKQAEPQVREWLAVLAHCTALQEATAILELDRVLESSPSEIDDHRRALRAARDARRARISATTQLLLARMDQAAELANAKVLLNPKASPSVVASRREVEGAIIGLHEVLGIERERTSIDSRRWSAAAADLRDRAREAGAEGVVASRRLGVGAVDRAKSGKEKVSGSIADVRSKRRGGGRAADSQDQP